METIVKWLICLFQLSVTNDNDSPNMLVQMIDGLFPLFGNDSSVEISFVDYLVLSICFGLFLWRIYLYTKHSSHRARLRESAIIVLLSGYIIYYIGFYTTGTASSFFALLARPFIASLGMFVANTSYQEVCKECINSSFYMAIFGLVHILAIAISAIFVVHFLQIRLLSLIRRWKWQCTNANPSTINIFFGLNNTSVVLAKSIYNEKKERIVFVDMPSEEDNKKTQISLGEIFGLFPYKREFINQLKDVRYVLMSADNNTSNRTLANDFFLDNIDVGVIRGFIRNNSNARIFFLSDNESANIQSLLNIMEDNVFSELSNNRVDIYCHARRNETNLSFEKIEFNTAAGLSVHIVDSSYLAVRWLKQQTDYLPVNYVIPNENGTVDTPFNALLVGFGEVGQEFLAYLYEFGAFPNSNHKKSPFCCYVVDRKMDELRNVFYLKHPALLEHQNEVILTEICDQKSDYYKWLMYMIKSINYLVIATGSDDENLKMAVDLYELAMKNRVQMDHFSIYVHISQQQLCQQLVRIRDNYSIPSIHIVPFGEISQIFSYDNIILDDVYRNALKNKDMYDKAYIAFDRAKCDVNATVISTDEHVMGKMFKMRREENQNISNWLHAETKFRLLGLSRQMIQRIFSSERLSDQEKKTKEELVLIRNYSHSDDSDSSEKFLYSKEINKIASNSVEDKMYNIALCEHLRWNAAHEMMGYTKGEEKNEIRKEHNCLDDWNNLPKFKHPYDMRDLDFLVLETSLKLLV